MEQKKEKKYIVGSIICGLLTAFGIVASVISIVGGSGGVWIGNDALMLILSVFVGYYAFAGYRKPHGNLLKYIILLYAVICLFGLKATIQVGNVEIANLIVIRIGILCYISGRLERIKENLILMILLTVIGVGLWICQILSGVWGIGFITFFIIWLDICVAYFLRYKQHREAGLMDAPKK